MRFEKMIPFDTGNWEGVNSTIFLTGCLFKCPGCFNEDIHSFYAGKPLHDVAKNRFITMAIRKEVDGICILGGEPFHQNLLELRDFIKLLKHHTNKQIHVWTGFKFETLLKDCTCVQILQNIDTLVDGRFILEEKDLMLKMRGSRNQRIIDVQQSLKENKVVEMIKYYD